MSAGESNWQILRIPLCFGSLCTHVLEEFQRSLYHGEWYLCVMISRGMG